MVLLLLPMLYRILTEFGVGFTSSEIQLLVAGITLLFGTILFSKDLLKKNLEQKSSFNIHILDIVFFFFCIWQIFPTINAVNIVEAVYASARTFLFFGFFLLFRKLFSIADFSTRKFIFQAASILSILLCVLTYYDILELIKSGRKYNSGNLYFIEKSFGHKNPLSAMLVLLLGFNLLGFLVNEGKRIFYIIAAILTVSTILILQSRVAFIAMLAFVVIVFVGWYLLRLSSKQKINLSSKRFAKFSVLGIGLAGVIAISSFALYVSKADLQTTGRGRSVNERLVQWNKTKQLIIENPILGVGPDNWKIRYGENGLDGLNRAMDYAIFVQPHNDFLWVFSETGMFGMILYLAIFGMVLMGIVIAFTSADEMHRKKLIVLFASIVGYIILANFTSLRLLVEHQALLLILFAIAIIVFDKFSVYNKFKINIKPIIPLVLLFLVGSFVSYIAVVRIYNMQIFEKTLLASDKKQWQKVLNISDKVNQNYYNLLHTGQPVDYFKGLANNHLGNLPAAQKNLTNALKVNPINVSSINMLGDVYFKQKQYEKAIGFYQKSLKINPIYEEAKFDLARANINLSRFAEARKWLSQTSSDEKQKQELMAVIEKYDR